MKVLVTGAAGFIGSNFVLRTLQTRPNVEIVGYDALTYAGNIENLSSAMGEIDFVQADIRDSQTLLEALTGCDLVVNFAAETHNDNSLKRPELFFDVNLNGTLSIKRDGLSYGVLLHQIGRS